MPTYAYCRDSNAKFAITIPSAYQTVKDAAAQAGVKAIFVIEEGKNGAFIAQDAPDGTPLPEFAEVNAKEDVVVLPYSSGTTGEIAAAAAPVQQMLQLDKITRRAWVHRVLAAQQTSRTYHVVTRRLAQGRDVDAP